MIADDFLKTFNSKICGFAVLKSLYCIILCQCHHPHFTYFLSCISRFLLVNLSKLVLGCWSNALEKHKKVLKLSGHSPGPPLGNSQALPQNPIARFKPIIRVVVFFIGPNCIRISLSPHFYMKIYTQSDKTWFNGMGHPIKLGGSNKIWGPVSTFIPPGKFSLWGPAHPPFENFLLDALNSEQKPFVKNRSTGPVRNRSTGRSTSVDFENYRLGRVNPDRFHLWPCWQDMGSTCSLGHVVASLGKTFYDDYYLCLLVTNKQQIQWTWIWQNPQNLWIAGNF